MVFSNIHSSLKMCVVLLALFTVVGCGELMPREKFRDDFNQKAQEFGRKIHYLGTSETESVEVSIDSDGRSRDSTMQAPISSGVLTVADSIVRMFKEIPEELLNQDIDGFDEWGKKLEEDFIFHQKHIDSEISQTKARILELGDEGGDDLIMNMLSLATTATIDRDNKLKVTVQRNGRGLQFYPGAVLDIDIDAWLEMVKQRSLQYQKRKENEPLSPEARAYNFTYNMATSGNNSGAQRSLASMYFEGDVVPANKVDALMWARIAEINGDEDAAELRKTIEAVLNQDEINEAESKAAGWIDSH